MVPYDQTQASTSESRLLPSEPLPMWTYAFDGGFHTKPPHGLIDPGLPPPLPIENYGVQPLNQTWTTLGKSQ